MKCEKVKQKGHWSRKNYVLGKSAQLQRTIKKGRRKLNKRNSSRKNSDQWGGGFNVISKVTSPRVKPSSRSIKRQVI